ncbi:MAG: DUF4868 domain-containing protein [Bacteroidales bacterium]|nr:DUF4868 domain-containing protein [Bacteroidales bacterium]
MEELIEKFEQVKTVSWNEAIVSFYIVKRKLVNREAKYEILQVNIDENLRKKLRKVASDKVIASNQAIEYDFNTSDLDDNVLGIATDETDLQQLIESINDEESPETAATYEDLLGSWIYIARLEKEGQILYSVRRVSEGWTAKKVFQLINMIFDNNMLVDLEQKEIFRIDGKVDFFSFEGVIFIADKKNFETALNFREGMERNRDAIVQEFRETNLFVDADEISNLVGNNIKRLRKLSQVKKAGYYKEQAFLQGLKQVNEVEDWGIQYAEDGKLIVTEEDIDIVLKVLNNDRLTSKINQENFDVDVKHKLGGN